MWSSRSPERTRDARRHPATAIAHCTAAGSCATLACALVLGALSPPACADAEGLEAKSGAFDMSNMLLEGKGVLPVPTVITEPAIGYGLGLALLYFSLPKSAQEDGAPASGEAAPRPNITGVAGFATGTHSWGGALLHTHSWDDDSIRYVGIIGKINLHLNYYGVRGNAQSYQLDGLTLFQQLLFRVGSSAWFIGPRYTYFDAHARFGESLPPELGDLEAKQRVAKGGLVAQYDTRDNQFYPVDGTYAEMVADFSRPALGSSTSFQTQSLKAFRWFPLSPDWVLGLRADTGFSQGQIPFFAQPYVSLRGVPDAKYQDRRQVTGEAEIRYNLTPVWSVLAFGGAGRAFGRLHSFADAPTAYGFGAGFRYLLVRKIGLALGIDIARGPSQNAFYVQIGSAWR